MFLPVSEHILIEVVCGVLPLVDAVRAHGVGEHVEHLVLADELVDQHLAALVVDIVVSRAVNQQQVPFQPSGEIDGRAVVESLGIGGWQAHVPFLVDGVIEVLGATAIPVE